MFLQENKKTQKNKNTGSEEKEVLEFLENRYDMFVIPM
jgi:hypothetical protein